MNQHDFEHRVIELWMTTRVPLTREKAASPVETFTIELRPAGKAARLVLSWADQSWSTEIKAAK